jgi:hypothetical protein
VRETPRPGGARTGGHGPEARVNVPPGGARAGGGEVRVSITAAVEQNIALPIEPAKSLLTKRDASPTEKRRWLAEEGYILAWAGAGASVGGALQGRIAALAGFVIMGYYAAWRVGRRG